MDEKAFGARVRARRKLLGWTQGKLAKEMLVSTDYISRIEKGERTPRERVKADLDDFVHGQGRFSEGSESGSESAETRTSLFSSYNKRLGNVILVNEIPVLGRISAGFPNMASQEVIEYISIPGAPKNSFALIVRGASMEPTFRDGDYVLFVENGDYRANDVLIVLDEWGEAMVKRLKEREGKKYLASDNPAYPLIEPNEHYRTIGKVVKVWRDIKF